jgi:poly(3-hydroxybutyrate) depolymerase
VRCFLLSCAILAIFTLSSLSSVAASGCGTVMPQQPHPGHTHSVSISVLDPTFGTTSRSLKLHLPSGYSIDNNVATPLVLDFHGWTGDGQSQVYPGGLDDVADEDANGGFIVAHGDGWGDPSSGHGWGSWNCSRTPVDGTSPPCQLPRPSGLEIHCYDTCLQCDPVNSCDWTACYDDEAFTRAVIKNVRDSYCLDEDSIHITGISNGGMFSYHVASRLNDVVASIAPVAGSPLIGFGDVPTGQPISLIDFHGLVDSVIPYDAESVLGNGLGPEDSVISNDLYYYEQKPVTIAKWVGELGCKAEALPYPTDMDGVDRWSCQLWSGCAGGTEVVQCTGIYAHNYPFSSENPPYIGGTRIMWDFMKNHRRNYSRIGGV